MCAARMLQLSEAEEANDLAATPPPERAVAEEVEAEGEGEFEDDTAIALGYN